MRWFRRNRRYGGVVALAALALQFAVAFSHVHTIGSARAEHPPTAQVSVSTVPAANGLSLKSGEFTVPAPSQRNAPYPSAPDCDICATINLTGTAQPATPPEFFAPLIVAISAPSAPDDHAVRVRRYVLAQPRAPPSA